MFLKHCLIHLFTDYVVAQSIMFLNLKWSFNQVMMPVYSGLQL